MKKGAVIGIIVGALVVIAGVVAALLIFKNKKSDAYRVIKVMRAQGHSTVARGDIDDLEAYEGMALSFEGSSIAVILGVFS